jgi:hypothetical protein
VKRFQNLVTHLCELVAFAVAWTRALTPVGGCGDSSAEREFLSDKVYRRNDRGVIGVEPFSPHRWGFFSVHTVLDVKRGLTVPACLGDRRNKNR